MSGETGKYTDRPMYVEGQYASRTRSNKAEDAKAVGVLMWAVIAFLIVASIVCAYCAAHL